MDLDKKHYILDTNVLLHDPMAFLNFDEHYVIIPMTVLEELDAIKDRNKDVSREARIAIRAMEDVLRNATPEEIQAGVPLKGCDGRISIYADHKLDTEKSGTFTNDSNDNRIINVALKMQLEHPKQSVVLVTKDINMRLKAKGAGLQHVEDYRTDQLVDDIKLLPKGYIQFEQPFWDAVKEAETSSSGAKVTHQVAASHFPAPYLKQYIWDNYQFVGQIKQLTESTATVTDIGMGLLMGVKAWGISPKNIYQGMALHALLDPSIDLVILTGPAGCGKTLLAMAAALELTVEKGHYERVIVTRNTPEIAESIGFLPGTEEEKMMPWLASVTDTLEVLHKKDNERQSSMEYVMEKANIQFKSVNFMRGRSLQNTFVLLDECQNMTPSQLKTIITRCGEGTKLVCLGNLAQIDSSYLSPLTSGLTYIVERFKNYEGSANVYLNGVVRSPLAAFAEEHL